MLINVIKDAILQNIGPLKSAPKGFLKRNCMLCQSRGHGLDKRNRFGIQFNTDSMACHCFNCAFSSSYTEGRELSNSFKFFLKKLQINDKFINKIEFEIFKQKNQISNDTDISELDNETRLRQLFQRWKLVDLPKDSLPITEWLKYGLNDPNFLRVVNYAIDRNIFDLDNFYWTPTTYNNLHQRLLIPYYFKGNIVGFTSRLCFDTVDKSIPKYYQECPTDFVFNLDNQQNLLHKYVIVTEGVLDAYVINGVSILGEIGQSKIDIINQLQKQIIVCPDRDKKGYDLVQAAIDNNWAVSFPKWSREIKDAAAGTEKYGRLLTIYSIISSMETGKLNIKLKWDIEQSQRNRIKKYD